MRITLIITLFASIHLFAQETKKITKTNTTPLYSKEVYYVLKQDKNVKHGDYFRYGNTGIVEQKGTYQSGRKVGVWEFYMFDGQLEQKYNFSENKLEYQNPDRFTLPMETEVNGTYVADNPDELPAFIGGFSTYSHFLLSALLKASAVGGRCGKTGVVTVSAIITTDGKLIDEKVVVGVGPKCDEAALKAIKNIPDEWIPGKVKGEPTNVLIFFPVTFK